MQKFVNFDKENLATFISPDFSVAKNWLHNFIYRYQNLYTQFLMAP